MDNSKQWYESKTIIINLIMVIIAVVGIIADNAAALDIPAQYFVYFTIAQSILNVFLRSITGQPLAPLNGKNE